MSGLDPYRLRLDDIDSEMLRLFGERFAICRDVAAYKHSHDIAMMQPNRVEQVRERYRAAAAEQELPLDFVEALFELVIAATCRMEDELMGAAAEAEQG